MSHLQNDSERQRKMVVVRQLQELVCIVRQRLDVCQNASNTFCFLDQQSNGAIFLQSVEGGGLAARAITVPNNLYSQLSERLPVSNSKLKFRKRKTYFQGPKVKQDFRSDICKQARVLGFREELPP